MNLTYRYMDITDQLLLFNRSDTPRYVFGRYINPGQAMKISAGEANTLKGMIRGEWMQLMKFSEAKVKRTISINPTVKAAMDAGYLKNNQLFQGDLKDDYNRTTNL